LRYLFDDCVLDTDHRELRREDATVSLEPLAFDVLAYLIRNRERVVSKDELREAVWGGRVVSESTVSSWMTTVRGAVGDNGEDQRLIRTLPRRGFRFVGSVSEELALPAGTKEAPPAPEIPTARSDPPSQVALGERFEFTPVPSASPAISSLRMPVVVTTVSVGALLIAVLAYFALVTFFPQKPSVPLAYVQFPNPRVNGRPVDLCLEPTRQCGGPAADRYCEQQNMQRAVSFSPQRSLVQTLILGNGELCDPKIGRCDSFSVITCSAVRMDPR
jgi:DNA-binding winged helix-turn-helix (wHTH) protein